MTNASRLVCLAMLLGLSSDVQIVNVFGSFQAVEFIEEHVVHDADGALQAACKTSLAKPMEGATEELSGHRKSASVRFVCSIIDPYGDVGERDGRA